jgi:UDP-N-acetylglucosamine 2-epimerase (non-hydrolysing)
VLVVGDVNSTIACALVASKVTYASSAHASQPSRPLVAHVEAGLRSFDRTMPEEINRVLTDAISDLLFITEDSARENLLREGVPRRKIHFVGNTMVDTLFKHRQKAQQSNILLRLGLKAPSKDSRRGSKSLRGAAASGPATTCRDYAVVTLHRPSNVDDRKTFREILEALSSIAKVIPIVFPTHPRTLHRIKEFHFEGYFDFVSQTISLRPQSSSIQCLEPLGYVDFLCLMSNAKLVLTDSGGLQEETTVLSIPCITLRQNTERPVTITHGTNVLAGTQKEAIVHCAFRQLIHPPIAKRPKLWDGRAGERIIKVLARQIADHDVCITGSKSPQGHSLRLQPAPDACVNSRCEQSPA